MSVGLDMINNAIELFDNLFKRIAPTNVINCFEHEAYLEIPKENLSEHQCEAIKHLSGFLISLKKFYDKEEFQAPNTSQKLFQDCNTKSSCDQNFYHSDELKKMGRTISILQEYLVIELNRSENCEAKLKEKEVECVELLDANASLQKKIRLSNNVNPIENAKNNCDSKLAEPKDYINLFIRKQFGESSFFGIIANYKAPYFHVFRIKN
jgi:hypothetical protein